MKSGYINLENGGSSYHKQAAEKSMFKELTPRVKTAAYCPPEGMRGWGCVQRDHVPGNSSRMLPTNLGSIRDWRTVELYKKSGLPEGG